MEPSGKSPEAEERFLHGCPETANPPIEPLRPPAGAPNVLVVPLDDRRVERFD
jgi:hypothetical protein